MSTPERLDARLLAALAEPNRLRIVELLNDAPRPVGEIAALLRLRQPQVTKHLQTLERVGLVSVHPLGQRRIYALDRRPFRRLATWIEMFQEAVPSEAVLDAYRRTVELEQARAANDPGWPAGRTMRLRRILAAPPPLVWRYWTEAARIRRWWSPDHFAVVECEADPIEGGELRLVIAEGDGTLHPAAGRYLTVTPPRALSFELAPLGSAGAPLFSATYRVRLAEHAGHTELTLTVKLGDAMPVAAPAIAGLRPGWRQLLEKLARELAKDSDAPSSTSPTRAQRRGVRRR
jgi:uncharacterized protein YndB with AHSA1/START domain/DNA-binding transcriptional ArsR family regulator